MGRADKKGKGLIFVYTGNGKGKTTAALGQAMRLLGYGSKVFMMQFMKDGKYGEAMCAEKYLPNFLCCQCGLGSFVVKGSPTPTDIELAQQGLETAADAVASGKYSLVILDEIIVAIEFKLIPIGRVLEILKNKPEEVNIILTGRNAQSEIIELADMVSEIREIKHHYSQGIKGKTGIEY